MPYNPQQQYLIEQGQRRQDALRASRVRYAQRQAEDERRRKLKEAEEARRKAETLAQQRLIEKEKQRLEQELIRKERIRRTTSVPEQKTIEEQQREIQKAVAESPIKLQIAYKRGGLDAYNTAVKLWNKDVIKKRLKQKLSIETLYRYKKGDQYNVTQYLKDNPDTKSVKVLENAGFDKDTIKKAKDYVYGLRKAETAFNNKNKSSQVFIVGQALGFKARQKASKSDNILAGLNKKDKQAVLEEFIKHDISPRELRHKSLELLKQEAIEVAPIYGLAVLGGVGTVARGIIQPIARVAERSVLAGLGGYTAYQTLINWDELNNKQKALGIAIATLMIAPAARSTVRTLKNKADPVGSKTGEIILQMQRPQDKLMTQIVKKQFGAETYNKLIKLNKAQTEYITEVLKAKKGKPNNKSLAGIKLEKVANEYTSSIKGKVKVDDPKIIKQINDMPKNIRNNVESIVDGLLPKKQQIKIAKQQFNKATKELKQARERWPTKPQKWADLILEQAVKENRFSVLSSRQSTNYQLKLIRLRTRLKEIEGLKPKKKSDRIRVLKEKNSLEKRITKVQDKYDKSLKSLEVEYGRGGQVSGRKGRTIVLTPRKNRGKLEIELRKQRSKFKVVAGTGGGAVSVNSQQLATVSNVKNIVFNMPVNISNVKSQINELNLQGTMTQADIKNITRVINKEGLRLKANLVTKGAINERVMQSVQPLQKPQELLATSTKLKVVTKTPTKTKTPTIKKGRFIPKRIPSESRDKKNRKAIKASLGAVTYRRGELNDESVWHTYHVDKGGELNRSIVVGPAPAGARVATGKGSTSTTLKRIKGKRLPNFTVIADTGAVDDVITASGGKLTLSHVPDRISGGGMKRISNGIGRLSPRLPKLR